MKIFQIVILAVGFLVPGQLVADEPTLSGHVEYHSADDKTTVAAFNSGKLYYDNNGTRSSAIALTEEQSKQIVKLGSEFQKIHGNKESKEFPDNFKGAIIIFSFKPPEAEETFTAGIMEDDKASWEALNKLREYLDNIFTAKKEEMKQNNAEMETPRKLSD